MSRILTKHTRSLVFSSLANLQVWKLRMLVSRSTLNNAISKRVFRCSLFTNNQRRWFVSPNNEYRTSYLKNHLLKAHIGDALSRNESEESVEKKLRNSSEFSVTFLGTSSGAPNADRMCSATLLKVNGQSLLFDAAEGVQRQLMQTTINFRSVTNIFITHLHGDHIFGLPGLLLGLLIASKSRINMGSIDDSLTINIYGPPGLYNYIAMTLSLSMTVIASGEIVVTELVGGDADPGPSNKKSRKWRQKNPRHENYLEISRRNLFRKTQERNEDGTWTLELEESKKRSERQTRFFVSAAEVKHVKDVMTFGYVVREEEPARNIDSEKAIKLGVKPGEKYQFLKKGLTVESDDGSHVVYPEQVLSAISKKKARKFAIIGDNFQLSIPLYRLCQDCDVLVHEATSLSMDADQAAVRGHSTPEIAGLVAKNINAKVLALNHFGGKSGKDEMGVLEESEKSNGGNSHILVTHDFLEISVPWLGFDNPKALEEENENISDVAEDKS